MRIVIYFASFFVFSLSADAQTYSRDSLNTHLNMLMEWWPGEYDNHEQIVRQSGGRLADQVYEPIYRIHSHFVEVDLPELGEKVLYIEEYLNNDPTNIYRIRVYALSVDEKAQGIRIKLHSFRAGNESMIGAWRNPERLAAIELNDLQPYLASCDVILRWEGRQFRGGQEPEACDAFTEEKSWYDYQVVVGPDYHWNRDQAISRATGEITWEDAIGSEFAWIQLDRARRFSCTLSHGGMERSQRSLLTTDFEIHSRGGDAWIEASDRGQLEFHLHTPLELRTSDSGGPEIYIREKQGLVQMTYVRAIDDNEFTIDLGWLKTSCAEQAREN